MEPPVAPPTAPPPPADAGRRALPSALGLYFALLLVSMSGIIAHRMEAAPFLVEVCLDLAQVSLICGWVLVRSRDVLASLRQPVRGNWLVLAVGLSIVTMGVAEGVLGILHGAAGVPILTMSEDIIEAGYGWAMVVLLDCVQPAIFEEIAFRGIIFSALRPILRPVEVVVVSALLFMALHLSPVNFPHTLTLGLVAGFLRLRTGSLLPGMLLHFSHNFLCVLEEAWLR